MKRVLASFLVAAFFAGCVDPQDRRPGLRLTGEVVAGAIDDWSFTNDHAEIFVETRTPYGIPHSVTIVCAALEGRLYIGARNPTEKRWVGNIQRDPRVRLGISGKVYEGRLVTVEDETEREKVYRAYAVKYDWAPPPPEERPPMAYFRVLPRSQS